MHTSTSKTVGILAGLSAVVSAGPCDIYAKGSTPCVAAHSTTRSLFSAYNGSLYQIKRASDNTMLNITLVAPGGIADSSAHDKFCSGTTCLITIIYDQTANKNDLTQAPYGHAARGPQPGGFDNLAPASIAPVLLKNSKVYGLYIAPQSGYRNDATKNIATGDQSEGLYAVLDGTHYDNKCCFDYGNAEPSRNDTGPGHMEAIYFGTGGLKGNGTGPGPWIKADLEDGLWISNTTAGSKTSPTITSRFVTAVVKGAQNLWAIRGGNAAQGSLSTFWSGPRPVGYKMMHKEGAIVLGVGGDNSDGGQGTFYEGAMTKGYPSDETENEVQADIVAAGYSIVKTSAAS